MHNFFIPSTIYGHLGYFQPLLLKALFHYFLFQTRLLNAALSDHCPLGPSKLPPWYTYRSSTEGEIKMLGAGTEPIVSRDEELDLQLLRSARP